MAGVGVYNRRDAPRVNLEVRARCPLSMQNSRRLRSPPIAPMRPKYGISGSMPKLPKDVIKAQLVPKPAVSAHFLSALGIPPRSGKF